MTRGGSLDSLTGDVARNGVERGRREREGKGGGETKESKGRRRNDEMAEL